MKPSEDLDKALAGYLNQKSAKDNQKNENYHFCMGIYQQLQKLNPASASFARMRIQQIMYEVEYPQHQFAGDRHTS